MTNLSPSRKRIGVPNWGTLIPGIHGYLVPGPTDPETWSLCESNIKVAIGLTELFWPPFVEFDGLMFRGSDMDPCGPETSKNIANWMKSFENDRAKVERMLNHIHLIDLLFERNNPTTPEQPEQMAYLASVLRDMWAAKLKLDYPDKDYIVELQITEPENLFDWLITFYRRTPESQ
jgi:hypothetical protein